MTRQLLLSGSILLLLVGCGSSDSTVSSDPQTETPDTGTLTPSSEISTCSTEIITDDTSFNDNPAEDIPYSGGSTVEEIQTAFNTARASDPTITKMLLMPSQSVWDSMSDQEKGLFLLNAERYDRGIKPFEGIDPNVVTIAQNYAQTIYESNDFDHDLDGSPFDRLNSVTLIANNHDFFAYGENLAAFGQLPGFTTEPVAKSIYNWIYDDFRDGNEWGHRNFCLATGLNDNSGSSGQEGLIGFGVVSGSEYSYFEGYNSTIVVMNAFDPSSGWDHQTTQTLDICDAASSAVVSAIQPTTTTPPTQQIYRSKSTSR